MRYVIRPACRPQLICQVMDAVLICCSNVLFENFAAFAVFAVVGNLRRWPQDGES